MRAGSTKMGSREGFVVMNVAGSSCLGTTMAAGTRGGPLRAGVDKDGVEGGTNVAVLGLVIAVEGGGGLVWDRRGCQS